MDVLREMLLILSVLAVFVFGYFVMARLDRFLDENRKSIEQEKEKEEPSCMMLTEELSEEEMVEEIRRFRKKHKSTRVMLYDSTDTKLSETMESHTEQKR